jgi:hypothetical protein
VENKAIKDLINKGPPIVNVPIDSNTIKLPIEAINSFEVDNKIKLN